MVIHFRYDLNFTAREHLMGKIEGRRFATFYSFPKDREHSLKGKVQYSRPPSANYFTSVDLRVLTNLDQLLIILKCYFFFIIMGRVGSDHTGPSLSARLPCNNPDSCLGNSGST